MAINVSHLAASKSNQITKQHQQTWSSTSSFSSFSASWDAHSFHQLWLVDTARTAAALVIIIIITTTTIMDIMDATGDAGGTSRQDGLSYAIIVHLFFHISQAEWSKMPLNKMNLQPNWLALSGFLVWSRQMLVDSVVVSLAKRKPKARPERACKSWSGMMSST